MSVLNLGIEGIMTFGAMIGWLAVYSGADLWTGLAAAALCGAMFGLLHAALTVPLGLSQHVTGLGITLFASSFSYYVFRLAVPTATSPPTIEPFRSFAVPGLSDIPFLGPVLFNQTAPTYLAFGLVAVLASADARILRIMAATNEASRVTVRFGPMTPGTSEYECRLCKWR